MRVRVISPIEHNGKRYEIGAALSVGDQAAAALIAAGAAQALDEEPEKTAARE